MPEPDATYDFLIARDQDKIARLNLELAETLQMLTDLRLEHQAMLEKYYDLEWRMKGIREVMLPICLSDPGCPVPDPIPNSYRDVQLRKVAWEILKGEPSGTPYP